MPLTQAHPSSWRQQVGPLTLQAVAYVCPALLLFNGLAMAPLLSLTGLAFAIGGSWRTIFTGVFDRRQWIILAAFLGWISVTIAWSLSPVLFCLHSLAMFIGTLAGGIATLSGTQRMNPLQRQRLYKALGLGLTVAILLLLGSGLFFRSNLLPDAESTVTRLITRMDRGATIMALLLAPALFGLCKIGQRRIWLAGLAIGGAIAILLSVALAAKIALLLGCVTFWIGRWRPWAAGIILNVVLALAMFSFPTLAQHFPPPQQSLEWTWLPRSAHHRLTIWSFAAQKIAEKPLFGWGFESARAIGNKQAITLTTPAGLTFSEELMPLHPHNGALQLWLELGGVGLTLVILFLTVSLDRLRRSRASKAAKALTLASFAAGAIISMVSFGFWQSWWQSALWLTATLISCHLGQSSLDSVSPDSTTHCA